MPGPSDLATRSRTNFGWNRENLEREGGVGRERQRYRVGEKERGKNSDQFFLGSWGGIAIRTEGDIICDAKAAM